MKNYNFKFPNLSFSLFILLLTFFVTSCGIYKKTNTRDIPINAEERARKNINEGRGISLKGIIGSGSTNYEFSSSNPLWRASLDTLDFLPLTTVDYSGGVLITDWYTSKNSDDAIKITIRFLSNEIRSDSLKIIVHEKICKKENNCSVNILNSKINNELITQILKKASILEKQINKK
jgi:hypothetical protein